MQDQLEGWLTIHWEKLTQRTGACPEYNNRVQYRILHYPLSGSQATLKVQSGCEKTPGQRGSGPAKINSSKELCLQPVLGTVVRDQS